MDFFILQMLKSVLTSPLLLIQFTLSATPWREWVVSFKAVLLLSYVEFIM